jgi:hypothetical protein
VRGVDQAKAKKAAKGDVQETPAKADKPTSTGAEVEIPEEIVQQVPASPSVRPTPVYC